MNAIEDNKALVRDFIDGLFTRGQLGSVDKYLAEDFVNHDPPFGAAADRAGLRAAGAMFRAAFPNWHSQLHLLVAEGDIVVEQFTAGGTHRGEIMGVAPTGRRCPFGELTSSGSATVVSRSAGAAWMTSASLNSWDWSPGHDGPAEVRCGEAVRGRGERSSAPRRCWASRWRRLLAVCARLAL